MNKICIKPLDAVIVGAGFSGIYQLYSLRDRLGLKAKILEAGAGVGGTWYWNRYPGARCDSESHTYCYYFNRELLETWQWTERYPGQQEILRYLNFCVETLNLRRDIYLNERVSDAAWDEQSQIWNIKTASRKKFTARFLITAVGCLSSTNKPKIEGLPAFSGDVYHTGHWPHEPVIFDKKRVAVIGTGSSGIQAIPEIAKQAKKLFVLQRTPNYSVPARNRPLKPNFHFEFVKKIEFWRAKMMESRHGHPWVAPDREVKKTAKEKRLEIMERAWLHGGLSFRESFGDVLVSPESNEIMSEFIRQKILKIVNNPETANTLLPKDHPFGTKRPPIDTNYFETFNRENACLIDLKANPITCCEENGIRLKDNTLIKTDVIVFATGFDAMTGSIEKLNLRGRDGLELSDAWSAGPETFLGLTVSGFPNLFIITGPGSPSVLTNMPRSIEQHVDWISNLIDHMINAGHAEVEADKSAARKWTKHVTDVANQTLLPKANHSWYLGANIPGKPRVFMPYANGLNNYRKYCDDVSRKKYRGLVFKGAN